MKKVSQCLFLCFLAGCGTDDNNSQKTDVYCNDPVEILGVSENHGYIVSFEDELDVNIVAVKLLEKYEDFEIYSTFSFANSFHGNSGGETLKKIQCISGVKDINYDQTNGVN